MYWNFLTIHRFKFIKNGLGNEIQKQRQRIGKGDRESYEQKINKNKLSKSLKNKHCMLIMGWSEHCKRMIFDHTRNNFDAGAHEDNFVF